MILQVATDIIPDVIDAQPYTLSGSCSDGATITINSDTGALISGTVYDRSVIPNTWWCFVSDMSIGANTLNITASL